MDALYFSAIFEVVAGSWGVGHGVCIKGRSGIWSGSLGSPAGVREMVDIDASCITSTMLTPGRPRYSGTTSLVKKRHVTARRQER